MSEQEETQVDSKQIMIVIGIIAVVGIFSTLLLLEETQKTVSEYEVPFSTGIDYVADLGIKDKYSENTELDLVVAMYLLDGMSPYMREIVYQNVILDARQQGSIDGGEQFVLDLIDYLDKNDKYCEQMGENVCIIFDGMYEASLELDTDLDPQQLVKKWIVESYENV